MSKPTYYIIGNQLQLHIKKRIVMLDINVCI